MADFRHLGQQRFDFSKATVLMIDPNVMCLDVATGILVGFGFRQLHRCLDLATAADIIKMHAVDLILIDPVSFGMAAFDFIKWIRSERLGSNSTVPILIVTGHTHVRLITSTRQCGADYVIAKPFSTRVLLERILWVAESEGRRGNLVAPPELVSNEGSGVEVW